VGFGVVMTYYHVIEGARWEDIQAEFDYQVHASGALVPSRFYKLSGSAIATSPWDDSDKRHPKPPAPPPDSAHLDFALLPVAGRPEEADMGGGRTRGVVSLPQTAPRLKIDTLLLILQHPQKPGEYFPAVDLHPLKFAFDVVMEVNEND